MKKQNKNSKDIAKKKINAVSMTAPGSPAYRPQSELPEVYKKAK